MSNVPAAEVTLPIDEVAALVAEQHPRFAYEPLVRAGEGWDNVTFRLGEHHAVRLPRRAAAVELLANEQRWLATLAPRLPLPVPVPVALGAPGRGFPWPWSVVPWLEGEPLDVAPPDASEGRVLAGFLRALHVPAPSDAPLNPSRGVPLATRRARLDACLERLRASTDLVTTRIERAWAEALAASEATTRVWLHGDLHAQNVLTRDGRLAAVLDWGDLCAGDAATDLGAVWGLLPNASARAEALAHYAPDAALAARARGWAIVFGATLVDAGRVDDPRHAAVGEAILRRLHDDA